MIHIPFKNSEFNNMCLIDTETGKEFTKIEDIEDLEIDSEDTEAGEIDFHKFYTKRETAFSHREVIPNIKELCEMLGIDWSNKPDSYDIQFQKIVQARKHKKRRINKKWLKRYGVKTVLVDTKGWMLKHCTDGTVEFIK